MIKAIGQTTWNTGKTRLIAIGALAAFALGCGAHPSEIVWFITTNNRLLCCRTIQFTTTDFRQPDASRSTGSGVEIHLGSDTVRGKCGSDAIVPITISNNSPEDIYIPISHELEGNRIKLFPWRNYSIGERPVRLARQIQYGDLIERNDATVHFYRLASHKEIRLEGWIPAKWLCTPPMDLIEGYLENETDPQFYSARYQSIRAQPRFDSTLVSPIGLRYDVAYTTLAFLKALPVDNETWSAGRDTVHMDIAVPEEPASFLNVSQKVAESNVVTLRIAK